MLATSHLPKVKCPSTFIRPFPPVCFSSCHLYPPLPCSLLVVLPCEFRCPAIQGVLWQIMLNALVSLLHRCPPAPPPPPPHIQTLFYSSSSALVIDETRNAPAITSCLREICFDTYWGVRQDRSFRRVMGVLLGFPPPVCLSLSGQPLPPPQRPPRAPVTSSPLDPSLLRKPTRCSRRG